LCIDQYCAESDLACASGYRYHESAGERAGECTAGSWGSGGGGSDGGGEPFADPVTTVPPGELGVSVDASTAQHDVTPSCATNPTGRDVMFEITVPASLPRLYVDTYETQFDIVLAVYEGSCATITPARELGCVNSTSPHACDSRTMQWAANVRAGVHCIVVDQAAAGSPTSAHVRGLYGPTAQTAELGTTSGTTCGHNAFTPAGACSVPNGPDETWFFMGCQGLYTAMTDVSWPGEIEARTENVQYDCAQGEVGADFTLARPGPVWLIAHQAAGTCGTVSVDIY
jgi:hypothetical protein